MSIFSDDSVNHIATRSTSALIWVLGGAVGKVIAQLTIQITLARLLGPGAFGQYAVLLAILSLAGGLADCGFGTALIQKKEITAADVSMALGWSLTIAIALAILIIITASQAAIQFADATLEPMLLIASIAIIPQSVANISTSLMQRDMNMKSTQIIHIISYTLFFGGTAIALASLGYGGWSLIIAYVMQILFSLIASYSICRHTLRPSLRGDLSLASFGVKSLASNLTNWSLENLDRFIIARFWGLPSLGLYAVAFNLSKAPSALLIYAVQGVTFSTASRLQSDKSTLRKGFAAVVTAMAIATLPLSAVAALESAAILNFIYGSKWIGAAPYMAALAISIPMIALGSVTAAILRGMGAIGRELRIQILTTFIFFCGFFFLRHSSLGTAVWVVPFAYSARLIFLLRMIQVELEAPIREILFSFRGAVVLTLISVSATTVTSWLVLDSAFDHGALPLLTGCFSCIFLLAIKYSWLLGQPLTSLIRAKSHQTRLAPIIAWLER